MEYIIDIRKEINDIINDYIKDIEKQMEKEFKKSLIDMIIKEFRKYLIIDKCEIDDFIKDKVKKYFINDNIIKEKYDKIINPIIENYEKVLKEKIIPPYLILCTSLYLKKELETNYYFDVDEEIKILLKYINDDKEKNNYINIWVFKKIIQNLCNLYGKDNIFCDEYTKQFSLFTIDLMINNFNIFISYKKLNLCMKLETRKKDFYEELYKYSNNLLSFINNYNLSIDNKIVIILKYQLSNSFNNIFSNMFCNIDTENIKLIINQLH